MRSRRQVDASIRLKALTTLCGRLLKVRSVQGIADALVAELPWPSTRVVLALVRGAELQVVATRNVTAAALDEMPPVAVGDDLPLARAVRLRQPVWTSPPIGGDRTAARIDAIAPVLPLLDQSGSVRGALGLGISDAGRFTQAEQGWLAAVADATALALSVAELPGAPAEGPGPGIDPVEHLDSIVEGTDDALLAKDAQGLITFWNPGAERLYGYPAEEAIGRHVSLLVPRDRRGEETRILEAILRGERVDRYETVRKTKTGALVPVAVTASPMRDRTGAIVGASVIARDIGDRLAAEAARAEVEESTKRALRSGQAWFRGMIDSSPMLVWQSSLGSKRTFFNARWLEFTGREVTEEFGDGWIAGVHPDDQHRCMEIWEAAMAERRPAQVDYRLRDHAGRYRWVRDYGVPVADDAGNHAGYVGGCVDVTERRAAETAKAKWALSLEMLAESAVAASSASSAGAVLEFAVRQCRDVLGADAAVASARRRDGSRSHAVTIALAPGTDSPVDISDAHGTHVTAEQIRALGRSPGRVLRWRADHTASMAVGLRAPDDEGVIGFVKASRPAGSVFDQEDEAILQQLAAYTATLLESARMREAIQIAEERSRALLEGTTTFTWISGSDGRFAVPQPGWESYTGQSWREHKDHGWLRAFHPDDRHDLWMTVRTALESGTAHHATARLFHAASGGHRWCQVSGVPIRRPSGDADEWVGGILDVETVRRLQDESERTSRSARLSAATSAALIEAELDVPAALDGLAAAIVASTGDGCVIGRARADGIELAAAGFPDPEVQATVRAHMDDTPAHDVADADVADSWPRPQQEDVWDRFTDRARAIAGTMSWKLVLCLPMRGSHGRSVGTLTVFRSESSAEELDTEERSAYESLADRAGIVISSADALSESEATTRTLTRLQGISDVALGSLGLDDLLEDLPTRLARTLGVDVVRILLLSDTAEALEVRGSVGLDLPEPSDRMIPITGTVAGLVARTRGPTMMDLTVDTPGSHELGLRVRSLCGVPLLHEDRLVGVLDVGTTARRQFSQEDITLLRIAAGRIATAVDVARTHAQQHEIALTLQASLLPARLPTIEGIDIAARYWAAGQGIEVGGDFYDAFALPEPATWGIAIGDVCGKGAAAAAVMGVTRSTLRAASRHQRSPRAALTWLNEALHDGERPETYCSTYYARVEGERGRFAVTAASAGHPYPVIVRADLTAEFLGRPGSLLGLGGVVELEEVTTGLLPGDTMVLYTDGVTDVSPPADIDDDLLQDLAVEAVRTGGGGGAERIADLLGEALFLRCPAAQRTDDIALVVLQVVGCPTAIPFHLDLIRGPEAGDDLQAARREFQQWLDRWGRESGQVDELAVIFSELTSNALAATGRGASVSLRAEIDTDDVCTIEVVNPGRPHGSDVIPAPGLPPWDSESGRGLFVVDSLSDSLTLTAVGDGALRARATLCLAGQP